jgi:ferredoxin-NADP reductase
MDKPLQERLAWQEARVTAIVPQTPTVKSYFVRPPQWRSCVAGQHVDVRLTAPDGYQAQRSYSIASAPDASDVELVVERLDDGEVSPFFHEVVVPGDTIELRGPIGGHFNWQAGDGGPLLLVGGGSGGVPLMSIVRHRAAVAPDVPAVLSYYTRRAADVIFRDELAERAGRDPNFHLAVTLTREQPTEPGWHQGRIDMKMVGEALAAFGADVPRHTYVCGSNPFVNAATRLLIEAGLPFASIRTERFGGEPTTT